MASNPDRNNPMARRNVAAAVEDVGNTLRFLEQMGCKGFDGSKEILDTLEAWERKDIFSVETLEDIRTDLGDCRRCRLSGDRTNIVFGSGNPHAKLVFIGEGPGYEEDRQGQPFVGAAGRLLTKIIEAIKLTRNQVYICNIVKCRAAIHPDFICTLGSFATQTLLETKEPISKLRGIFYDYMGIKVMPTYHPAFLLRNPAKKRSVWEDMKKLMKALGVG